MFCLMNAFAAGALLAAAFYLMLYEATHLIVRVRVRVKVGGRVRVRARVRVRVRVGFRVRGEG